MKLSSPVQNKAHASQAQAPLADLVITLRDGQIATVKDRVARETQEVIIT